MGNAPKKHSRSAVRRDHAADHVLTALVAFAVTVIFTRAFLELTGFPQIGNDVIHIAHALWGGLLLFVANLLPLVWANRWAIKASALLGGIGTGLFIDEVGKFITQANDYFFPPALPLIYGFFLLTGFVYLYSRRPQRQDARRATYQALDGLQDVLDGDLSTEGAARIEAQLATAKKSDREEIVCLANAIGDYLEVQGLHLPASQPGPWERTSARLGAVGRRLGRQWHRAIIAGLLIVWASVVTGYIVVLAQGSANIDPQVAQWRVPLIGIQAAIDMLMMVALVAWLSRKEERGLKLAVGGFLLSLVALQTLYFYISQFSALTSTMFQVFFLQILLAYRRWYL